jgi:hypothetical protein
VVGEGVNGVRSCQKNPRDSDASLGYIRIMSTVTFDIDVTYDARSGVWIGLNEQLPVATEANSYEALVDRVWQIAPEMAELNGFMSGEDRVRLRFHQDTEVPLAWIIAKLIKNDDEVLL